MPSTRQRTTFRKRNLRNGAMLAMSEAVKLVNLPLAQDIGRHLKQVALALKPSVLQAPKANDSDAKDLAKHVEGLLDVLNTAVQHLDGLTVPDDHANMTVELGQLQVQLASTYTELQDIQNYQYSTKLASQAEIRGRILELNEQLSRTIVDLTLRLLVIMLGSGAQSQLVMARQLSSTARERSALVRDHNTLVRKHASLTHKHNTLVRGTRRYQRISDKRIRNLTQEVNAVRLMRETDEQCCVDQFSISNDDWSPETHAY